MAWLVGRGEIGVRGWWISHGGEIGGMRLVGVSWGGDRGHAAGGYVMQALTECDRSGV